VLGFQPIRRFNDALAFHAAWKGAVPSVRWRKLSLLAFGLYAGLPLMLAVAIETVRSGRDLFRGRRLVPSLWSLGVVALLLLLAAQQGTNEVARLWLFMVPLLALAAGAGLQLRNAENGGRPQLARAGGGASRRARDHARLAVGVRAHAHTVASAALLCRAR